MDCNEPTPVLQINMGFRTNSTLMNKRNISGGVVHSVPADLRQALAGSPEALAAWEDITALARNEWICWTVSVKKPETRKEHVRRAVEDLVRGKRRPCCWPGCPHR